MKIKYSNEIYQIYAYRFEEIEQFLIYDGYWLWVNIRDCVPVEVFDGKN